MPSTLSDSKKFRFQTGSIKSGCRTSALCFVFRFDSKLVRLKAAEDTFILGIESMFRFQTGSIKSLRAGTRAGLFSDTVLFRFQTGSIKRHQDFGRTPRKSLFRFQTGSIKSRKPAEHLQFHLTCFDSKLVRLKANSVLLAPHPCESFDSKLVRLKVTKR